MTFKKLEQENVNELYFILYLINHIFTQHNVPYILTAGSLLGSTEYRSKSVMQNDDDIDLAVPEQFEDFIWSLRPLLERYGLAMASYLGIIKIFPINGKKIFNYQYPFLDIFLLTKSMFSNVYVYKGLYNRIMFNNEYFYPEELFPLKRVEFGPLQVLVPNNPEPYLDRTYGPDWRTVRKNHIINHDDNSFNLHKQEALNACHVTRPSKGYINYRLHGGHYIPHTNK